MAAEADTPASREGWEALHEVHDLVQETQLARLGHLGRQWQSACDAKGRAWQAYAAAAADLALLRTGYRLKPGHEGDDALAAAKAEARSDKPTGVQREHPIEAMFRRGQLRAEWRPLFERYVDICAEAEGASVGVVDLDRFVTTTGRSVPTFKTRAMAAVHEKESDYFAPIRVRAGDKALSVFDVTHRFGRELNTVMSVSQLGADGRFGKRNKVGQLLQRAYEAVAEHHGITAARARARFKRDADARPTQLVNPLTAAEKAEIDSYNAERAAEARAFEAQRYQQTKDRATELQRQRRAGERRTG